jgi:small basic protein
MAVAIGAGLYVAFDSVLLAGVGAVGAAATTFVGSIYPDVDHHNSVPRRKATRAFRLLVVMGVFSLAIVGWDPLVSAVETAEAEYFGASLPASPAVAAGVIVAVTSAVLAALVDPAIGLVTRSHRAWTHSVLVNFVLTGIVVAAVLLLTVDLGTPRRAAAVAVVGTFLVGTLVHLGLDGEIV